MKTIKRVLSLITAISLILVSISITGLAGEAVAETNVYSGIIGTKDVGTVPDELLQSGEWLYYLDGDEAIIAGYRNNSEQALRIPFSLNRHNVVGIGQNAFQNNDGLRTVQIHSMVNRIAENVFQSKSSVTVEAYSGAYAMQYAKEHSMQYVNLSNNNLHYTFSDNVIDFSGFPSKQYSVDNDNAIFVSDKLSEYLESGKALFVPKKSSELDLFLYEIDSINQTNNGVIVTLKDIKAIDEIIDRIVFDDVQLEMDIDSIRILNEGVVPDAVDSAIRFSSSSSKSKSFTISVPIGSYAKVSGKLSASFSGTTSIDLLTFPWLSISSASIVYNESITNELTLSLNGEPTEAFKKAHTVPLFEVPLVGGPVTIKLKVMLDVSVTGSVTVKSEIAGSTTITKVNGKWDVQSKFEKKKPVIEAAIKGSIGVKVELSANLGFSIGNHGIELTFLQLAIKGSFDVEYKITTRLDTQLKCRELTIAFNITFTGAIGIVKLNVLGLFKGVEAKYEYSRKISLLTIKTHFDDTGKGLKYVDFCKVGDRDVVFKYFNGQPDYTIKADAGSKLTEPNSPSKVGFTFGGWYYVSAKAGYAGPYLTKWNFNKHTLPYKFETGPYVFMAKWLLPGEKMEEDGEQPEGEDGGSIGGGTWHSEPPKPVEVTNITLNRTNEKLYVDGQYKDDLNLYAVVSPANAEDTSVSWSSSNPSVATVDNNGLVSAVAQGETKIICRSNMNPNVSAECLIHVYQPVYVSDIQLDKSSVELWANEADRDNVQLNATVIPSNATYSSVHWTSSNEDVAWVDGWGKVTGLAAGTATITCMSIKNQEVKATCQVTVHQHVRDVYLTADKEGLLPGETVQLNALCFPTNADNMGVNWTSSNEAVATVNAVGLVTAHSYGESNISATTVDGGNVSGTYAVSVEHELALIGNVQNEELFLDGDDSVIIGYAYATQGSIRRIIEQGYDLEWTLLNNETEVAEAYFDVVPTTYTVEGKDYDIPSVVLYSGDLHKPGNATFTLQCKAGPYLATVDLSTTVSGEALAKSVTLDPSTFDLSMNEVAHIPNAPISTDGGVVPRIMSVTVSGDAYYRSHAHESSDDAGMCVWFPESGQYSANVIYKAANITYTVPVTFQVRDENGIMRLPVTEVVLSDSFVNMVVGDSYQLTAEVMPADAYDRSVTWTSEDESIATISQDGLVTAKSRGMVYIHCEANDGSGCFDSCVLNVEPFLSLNETNIEKSVYMDGQTHVAIDSCSLTYQSAIRIDERGLTPNWKLNRISGDSTDIALNEFTAVADGNVRVEGEELELLRTNHVGVDKYQLVCEAGEYSAICDITLTVVEDGRLPESIALVTDKYEANVGEAVVIDTTVTCTPGTVVLPDDVSITLEPTKGYWNALEDGTYFADFSCTFKEAGEYTAKLVYSGVNYRYELPFSVRVNDENGNVPVAIQDIIMSKDSVQLFVGDSEQLTAIVVPETASSDKLEWSSFDTSIATVSEDGVITAMEAGVTYVIASSPKSDYSAICVVTVEDGLTLDGETLTKTIFVDGTTRAGLDSVYLTEASSKRLNRAPEWRLQRVSGNNLTLRAKECESANANGDVLYGCNIILYSVSAEGQTVYDLVCSSDDERTSIRIIVNAVNRENSVPASIVLTPASYDAEINELIVVNPEVTCWPVGTQLPVGTRVEFVGDKQFLEALNQEDWFVSQSISTFSFKEAGRFEANCVYQYSNISYSVPVTFNIRNEQGKVPVHGTKMQLNKPALYLVADEEETLEAIFTPVDVTDSNVNWESLDPSVATVDGNGHVRAVSNGSTEITCTPSDSHCSPITCYVTVEDYLTVETGNLSYSCYLEGEQNNSLSSAWLSEGTVMRLKRDDIQPTWTLKTTNGSSAVIAGKSDKDGSRILVETTSLVSAGITEYTIQCVAGTFQWSQDYSVAVNTTAGQMPEQVTLNTPEVNLLIGETKTIDFTPVCLPEGTALPESISTSYIGIGGFYDSLDRSAYSRNGDNVTVAFTKPGRYLLVRVYRMGNIDYTAQCVINVESKEDAGFGLLKATEQECIVYLNGKSGAVADISIYDAMVYERYGDDIQWTVERLSGDSVLLGLVPNADTATLFVADAEKVGTDVWRVSCEFGGLTDFIDIVVEVQEARRPIPTSIELSSQRVTGVIGNWLYLPLGVKCTPEGSALPETGDAFWRFKMLGGLAEDVSESKIENGALAVCFSESGYYTGTLTYSAGNVSYSSPVYFTIRDEEDQIDKPDQLKVWLLSDSSIIYPEGETGVTVATAVLAESLNSYYAGTTPSYASEKGIEWSVVVGTPNKVTLGIQPHTANTADIMIGEIQGTGYVEYTVSCMVEGSIYTGVGTLHVASEDEERPDVTLEKSRYQVTQGTPALISRVLYQRSNGNVLQSAGEWNVGSALSAIGYSYETEDNDWKVTFYKQGEYTTTVSTYVGNLRYDLPLIIKVVGKNESEVLRTLKLPKALVQIEEEAFSGLTVQVVDMRGTMVNAIGDNAFKNCTDLVDVYIPDSVTSIASNAFYGCINLTIHCTEGSVADLYAVDHGIDVSHDM